MTIYDVTIQNEYLQNYSSMISNIVGRAIDIKKQIIKDSIYDIVKVEHKMEFVLTINGISFINDSISTNLNSTWFSLESVGNEIVWIVDGNNNITTFNSIKDIIKQKVFAIIIIGENKIFNKKIIEFNKNVYIVSNIEDSVQLAYKIGKRGTNVLFSPASSSFNKYKNYKERGICYKKLVKCL